MNDIINIFFSNTEKASILYWVVFGLFFLIVYFLPTLIALVFNRRHFVKIATLNIPAGFSLIAWGALIAWAATGKMGERLKQRLSEGYNL